MTSYRTVIVFELPEPYTQADGTITYVNRIKYLPIDYLESRSIQSSAQVVSQPMLNGDVISDHMYRNPTKLTISGKFSLNGRNWNNSTYSELHNEGDRLTAIEYIFERIKNEGILCNITTVATDVDTPDNISYDKDGNLNTSSITPSQTRFLTRENMALTDISWKEEQNTLGFSFNFQEVIMVHTEAYEVKMEDLDLPSLNEPPTQSLGEILFATGELPLAISKTLYNEGYIKDDWLKDVANSYVGDSKTTADNIGIVVQVLISTGLIAGVIVASIAVSASAIGATIISATAAVVPVGTIVAAAVAIVAAIGIGIWAIINNCRENEKAKRAFKLINGDYKQDLNRYMNFMDDVQMAVNSASASMSVYQFTVDDEQQICIPIGGNYYYITVTKVGDSFKSDVRVNGFGSQGGDPISSMRENWCPISDFMELNENENMWFKDESKQYQVYLVNPNLSDEVNPTEEEKENVKKKLNSYYIYVSKGSVKANIEKIQNAIHNALLAHDFD